MNSKPNVPIVIIAGDKFSLWCEDTDATEGNMKTTLEVKGQGECWQGKE